MSQIRCHKEYDVERGEISAVLSLDLFGCILMCLSSSKELHSLLLLTGKVMA